MNVRNWINDIIQSDGIAAMPVMTHPGIELLGFKVKDAVMDGEAHYRAVRATTDRFPGAVACTTIMDLTVEAEAFGADIYAPDHEIPTVRGRLLSSYREVATLQIPSLDNGRLKEYLKADRLSAQNMDKPVFAGCIGPYTLAGRLYDMTEIMMAIYLEPETAELLLEKCTEFLVGYCTAIKETGVAGVIMAEPASGLLSNEDCMTFSSAYVKRIIDAVQDDSFAVVLHNCGNTGHCTGAMVHTGAMAYHFGNRADMVQALMECPSDVLVMGNLDPVGILKEGSPDTVRAAAEELLSAAGSFPNFVLSTGCDTPPCVPFENIDAFYSAI